MEQKLKILISEYVFQICFLQQQLEDANKKIAELEKENNDRQNNTQ